MLYFKIPIIDFSRLTNAERSVLIQICFWHFRYGKGDFEREIYLTDRKIRELCGVSRETICKAKKKLAEHGAISYRIFNGKTYYKILIKDD